MSTGNGWDGILEPGESIIWQGQPLGGIVWANALSPIAFMGAFFTAFSLFWIVAAATMTSGQPFPFNLFALFGLPFLAAGLFMLGGHVVLDAYLRSSMWYTLTDRTAFIATNAFGRKSLETYPLAEMPFLELDDGKPGSIFFSNRVSASTSKSPRAQGSVTPRVGFRHLADARSLYGQMRGLRRDARARAEQ